LQPFLLARAQRDAVNVLGGIEGWGSIKRSHRFARRCSTSSWTNTMPGMRCAIM
jgi:hypothetical protein